MYEHYTTKFRLGQVVLITTYGIFIIILCETFLSSVETGDLAFSITTHFIISVNVQLMRERAEVRINYLLGVLCGGVYVLTFKCFTDEKRK